MTELFAMYLSAETRESKKGSAVIVHLLTQDGEVKEFTTSVKFWSLIGKFISDEHPYCRIKYVHQPVGTEVTKSDGTKVKLDRASDHLEGCIRIPEKIWEAKVDTTKDKKQQDAIELLAAVAPDTLATYLRAIHAGV